MDGKFQYQDKISFIKPNSEAVQKKGMSYINNTDIFNDVSQNFSLNELINANHSVIDNPVLIHKDKLNNENTINEESNLNVSPVMKDLTDTEFKEMGSIELIGITKENDNNSSFEKGNPNMDL